VRSLIHNDMHQPLTDSFYEGHSGHNGSFDPDAEATKHNPFLQFLPTTLEYRASLVLASWIGPVGAIKLCHEL